MLPLTSLLQGLSGTKTENNPQKQLRNTKGKGKHNTLSIWLKSVRVTSLAMAKRLRSCNVLLHSFLLRMQQLSLMVSTSINHAFRRQKKIMNYLHAEVHNLHKDVTHRYLISRCTVHLNSHTVDIRTLIAQGQITSPYTVLEITSTLNLSCLKYCWYEVRSTELHLSTVPAGESKHYKDSRSEVKSKVLVGKEKTRQTHPEFT